jgi:phosphomannomutase
MAHEDVPIDGDDFNACFVRLLRSLFDSINLDTQKIGSVGNITSNVALGRYMETLRAEYTQAAVGVRYLFAEVKKYDIGCYFENSGHGCLYFSKEMRSQLDRMK